MKLDKTGVNYTVNENVEDMEKIGIKSLPYLQVDGKLLDFGEAIAFVKKLED
jgi:hypothetical protein